MDLRCPTKKHGVLADLFIEFKCTSRFCGAESGSVVVLHRFDVHTGELVETLKFKDPARKEKVNGADHNSVALRAT